jgi:dihydroorotase
MIGLELCLPLVLELQGQAGITLSRLVDALSTRPAKIIGIEPPSLSQGARAELVLFDPNERWRPCDVNLRSKSSNTPFYRRELQGRVLLTMAGGHVAYDAAGGR